MTLEQTMTKARRLARVDSTGKLDSEVMDCVNEGMKAFVKRVHDVVKEEYLQITPSFNTSTFMALNIEIVGGANALAAQDVTYGTAQNNVTGTVVATTLQTVINAAIGGGTVTVTWSTTEWKFILSVPGATSVTITAPETITLQSACEKFGLSGTVTSSVDPLVFNGTMPEDCTNEVSLPADFLALVIPPEWDQDALVQSPLPLFLSPEIFGEPSRYYVRNDRILLSPSPNVQGSLKILYRYWPTEFVTVSGYQEPASPDIEYSDLIGITGQHYFKVSIDDNAQVEYDITIPAAATWNATIALMNTAVSGATFSIVGSQLRCTSDTEGSRSSINLAAGTTGTDFFNAAGVTSLGTPVDPEYGTDVPIDDNYCLAIVHHVAAQLLEESFEIQLSLHHYAQFERYCGEYITMRENQNTSIFPRTIRRNDWEVEPFASS